MTFIERAWYHKALWLYALWPLHWLFTKLAARRRKLLSAKASSWPVPVVVVGNISVGGTGKTPLLIALVAHLQNQGINPGVVSRGYGSKSEDFPVNVTADTAVEESGDEALLIARHCGCPVVIDPDRVAAITCLLDQHSVDVVLCDDGLQHYAMARDIELIVVDGERQFGNGLCLPAGPLREPLSRLGEADLIIVNGTKAMATEVRATLLSNGVSCLSSVEKQSSWQPVQEKKKTEYRDSAQGFEMTIEPDCFINVLSRERRPYGGAPFKMGSRLQAVSGLGNPERFYSVLDELPHQVSRYSFRDHHWFRKEDFDALGLDDIQPIVMTEKDAVKIEHFARNNFWYLSIRCRLSENLLAAFDRCLATARAEKVQSAN
ncbi:MAG: tetraacyldisaccharide 4'-kinase [Proteobacteria bacterium]|nr:tetraacyldisaccharide 4'-kinase [Pseudomonadales bacterium]MBL6805123.1 tetraacyldisaccharide 4'-kinase [Pseudomonadales bacterium]MDA0895867.1 tetraacyldisaccharide 4'-kinase [Pseudomonadota bacterium]